MKLRKKLDKILLTLAMICVASLILGACFVDVFSIYQVIVRWSEWDEIKRSNLIGIIMVLTGLISTIFIGLAQIAIDFGFLLPLARLAAKLIRAILNLLRRLGRQDALGKLKPRRTYGREFLMLCDPGVRQECAVKLGEGNMSCFYLSASLMVMTMPIAAGLAWKLTHCTINQKSLIDLTILVVMIINPVITMFFMRKLRNEVLRNAYRQHVLSKAQAARDSAIQNLNAGLPERHYRIALPEASPDTLRNLRGLADVNRLPPEISVKISRAEVAQAELEAAEQDCAALQSQPDESKAQTT